jgi:hypothetical protein
MGCIIAFVNKLLAWKQGHPYEVNRLEETGKAIFRNDMEGRATVLYISICHLEIAGPSSSDSLNQAAIIKGIQLQSISTRI